MHNMCTEDRVADGIIIGAAAIHLVSAEERIVIKAVVTLELWDKKDA